MSTTQFPKSDRCRAASTPTEESDGDKIITSGPATLALDDDPSVISIAGPSDTHYDHSPELLSPDPAESPQDPSSASPADGSKTPPELLKSLSKKKRDSFDWEGESDTGPTVSKSGRKKQKTAKLSWDFDIPDDCDPSSSISKQDSLFAVDGYFMPFVGQTNPLMSLPFADSDNEDFAEYTVREPFKPVHTANDKWIAFNQELFSYLNDYFSEDNAVSERQFKKLLAPHLPGLPRFTSLRAGKVLRYYQTRKYTFSQAVRDFHEFGKNTIYFSQYYIMKNYLESRMAVQPNSRLTLHLYYYPRALRPRIFEKIGHLLNPTGFPRCISEADFSTALEYMQNFNEPHATNHFEPAMGGGIGQSQADRGLRKFTDREIRPLNPSRKPNPYWLGRREGVKRRGIKPRNHQAFVDPYSYQGGPIVTTEEINYRRDNSH